MGSMIPCYDCFSKDFRHIWYGEKRPCEPPCNKCGNARTYKKCDICIYPDRITEECKHDLLKLREE